MANILVSGASGFVGRRLVSHLLDRGDTPIALFKDKNRKFDAELMARAQRKGAIVHGDILDRDLIRRVVSGYELDYIIHLAAVPIVKQCDADPWTAYRVNVLGTVTLLDAVRDEMQRNPRIQKVIHMSSDKSYGGSSPVGGYTEDTPFEVTDTYCTSKACGDMIARSYAKTYHLPICVVRCGNLYGGGDMNLSRLIPGNILRLLNGQQPVLFSDAANMAREFVHISDLLRAYDVLLEQGQPGEAYNVGTEKPYKILDVINMMRDRIDPSIEIRIEQRSLFEITSQSLRTTKLRSLNWGNRVDLSGGLDEAIGWYRAWKGRIEEGQGQCPG